MHFTGHRFVKLLLTIAGVYITLHILDQQLHILPIAPYIKKIAWPGELRSGKMSLLITGFSLPDFIVEMVTRYREKAAGKAITFRISYEPAAAKYDITADEEKLSIITGNLLENAIKYAPLQAVIDCLITKKAESIIISFANPVEKILTLKSQA